MSETAITVVFFAGYCVAVFIVCLFIVKAINRGHRSRRVNFRDNFSSNMFPPPPAPPAPPRQPTAHLTPATIMMLSEQAQRIDRQAVRLAAIEEKVADLEARLSQRWVEPSPPTRGITLRDGAPLERPEPRNIFTPRETPAAPVAPPDDLATITDGIISALAQAIVRRGARE